MGARFGARSADGVTIGIGDDAAVLRPPEGRELVWTVDAQVDGQHFRRAWLGPADVGWRSFVAAASDLSAMGATPWCALSSLCLPDDLDDDDIDALCRGQAEAAAAVGCPVVGGNLSRGAELSVTTTLLGTVTAAVARTGARADDGLWLAGEVGLARAGLLALERRVVAVALEVAVDRFRRPVVRVEAGERLAGRAHAAIDVSDGLARDALQLADASGVAVVFDERELLDHMGDALSEAAAALGEGASLRALVGGEDYALLAASAGPIDGFSRVGHVEPGRGLWLQTLGGGRSPIEACGFDHFASGGGESTDRQQG
jgi:thiamine-monophosphate kinase